ncbi:hypothetical protein GH714_004013 [Hevea brasiliensis]|uniref:Uncharacterized protein n=1 Tax=Hevea brasiliensis TaxID=3981 RepID=A0A6A6K5D9_HEVBR|nr:hypothetical protein GH714_004013 [Hevea brasiliensis]
MKASSVLMQLISCGSISFRDCGATAVKEQGFSLIGHYKGRLPRVGGNREGTLKDFTNFGGVRLEDKEYFSGSLIETKREEVSALKRSNSYDAIGVRSCNWLDRKKRENASSAYQGSQRQCQPRKRATLVSLVNVMRIINWGAKDSRSSKSNPKLNESEKHLALYM